MLIPIGMLCYSAQKLLRVLAELGPEELRALTIAALAMRTEMPCITVRRQVRRLAEGGYISLNRLSSNRPWDFQMETKAYEELHKN